MTSRQASAQQRLRRGLVAVTLLAGGWLGGAAAPALAQGALPNVQGVQVTDLPASAAGAPPALPLRTQRHNGPAPRVDDSEAARSVSQPGNNAPFWRAVRGSGDVQGTVNLPGAEKGVLIQRFVKYPGVEITDAGEAWRQVRNRFLIPYGGWLIAAMLFACTAFFFAKGPFGRATNEGPGIIQRFTPFERAAHWCNAAAFVLLAISGLVMAFGKFLLLPLIGHALFGWLTYLLKTMHNFVGPLFMITLPVLLWQFLRDNIANAADLVWLRRLGGLLGGDRQVPSGRFNAGEKGMYWWGFLFPGALAIGSGLYLDKLLPGLDYLRDDMQVAHMLHAVGAFLMITAAIAHIYMGTVGTRGAYRAMRTGWVDEAWAREHHELWLEDVQAGRIPAQRAPEGGTAAAVADAIAPGPRAVPPPQAVVQGSPVTTLRPAR